MVSNRADSTVFNDELCGYLTLKDPCLDVGEMCVIHVDLAAEQRNDFRCLHGHGKVDELATDELCRGRDGFIAHVEFLQDVVDADELAMLNDFAKSQVLVLGFGPEIATSVYSHIVPDALVSFASSDIS